MPPRILVSIASYRDTECQWTIRDLFEKASEPARVSVGVCWQFIREEDTDCFAERARPEQCRVIEVDARESRGVCWARARILEELWAGEEYVLQIDAHSRFARHWDETLIGTLRACPSERAVLSTYPASYVPPDKLGADTIARISPKEFDDRGILTFGSKAIAAADAPGLPEPTLFVGAGLIFAPSQAFREVPYDPHIYFLGEEITLAARLWTHGWDLFIPNRVTVYHEYSERPNKRRHWHDHKRWIELSERAARRIRHLLGTESSADAEALRELERFGLGAQRTLAEYERLTGVDFKRRLIGGKTREEMEAALPREALRKRIAERFTEIWRSNGWGCAESRSGPGSTLAQTETLRRRLPETFASLGVRTLVDAGCGDLNWVSTLSDQLDLYLGYDVVEDLVAELRRRYAGRRTHFFNAADITEHVLARADALLCRDVLTHLSLPLAQEALDLLRKSGARYLIATTFPRGRNDPIRIGGWQPMDLCAPPFSLPAPKLLIAEGLQNSAKSLGVWALEHLS